MKEIIDGVIVVEGKSDVALLSNYFECEYVTTNGSDIPQETITYLKEISKRNKKIIVLTDPDSPGKRIRDILDNEIEGLYHCFISKEFAVKNGKVGVAECDIDEIKRALKNQFKQTTNEKPTLFMEDLYDLELCGQSNSKELREKVSSKFNLGFANAKTLLKRLNSVNITKEQLEKIINE